LRRPLRARDGTPARSGSGTDRALGGLGDAQPAGPGGDAEARSVLLLVHAGRRALRAIAGAGDDQRARAAASGLLRGVPGHVGFDEDAEQIGVQLAALGLVEKNVVRLVLGHRALVGA